MVVCTHCGGTTSKVRVERELTPWWGMLGTFVRNLFTLSGALQLLAVGAFLWIAGFFLSFIPIVGGIVSFLVTLGIFASWYFVLIRDTAFGSEALPTPEAMDSGGTVGNALFRFIIATALIWLPLALHISENPNLPAFPTLEQLIGDPTARWILLGSVFYFPAAIIATSISGATLPMLNPMTTLSIIFRIPGQYAVTVVAWGALYLLGVYADTHVWTLVYAVPVPILVPIVVEALGLVLPAITGFILGRLIYQNAHLFGTTRDGNLDEEQVPNAEPEGHWEPPEAKREAEAEAPAVALAVAGAVGYGGPVAVARPPAEMSLGLAPAPDDGVAADLAAYRELVASGGTWMLDAEGEMRAARLLEEAGDELAAAAAYQRVAQRELTAPFAAEAMVRYARLAVRRGASDRARDVLRHVTVYFDEGEWADRARTMLERLSG